VYTLSPRPSQWRHFIFVYQRAPRLIPSCIDVSVSLTLKSTKYEMMKLSAKLINLKQNEIKLSILKSDLFSSRTGAMHGTLCLEVHLHEHCKPKHELRNISISTCYMFSAMTLSITTLSIKGLSATLSINDTQLNITLYQVQLC